MKMAVNPFIIHEEDQHLLATVFGIVYYSGNPNGTSYTSDLSISGPIHYAATNSHDNASVMEMLLDFGADINLRDSFGQTALHLAAFDRRKNIVNTLLNRGADVSVTDDNGNTPLIWAVVPNECMDSPYTHPNQIPIIRSLIEHHADVNARNSIAETPLMQAALGFNSDVVKILLEAGANAHCKSERNQNCLHYLLCRPGKKNMLKKLVKAGASVFDRDVNGVDPIHRIVESRNYTMEQKVEDLKELMKIATLVNYTEKLDFRINGRLRKDIGVFDEECYAEVQTMQSITLSSTCALSDFALHGLSRNPPSIVNLAFEKLMEHEFVIYNDYLASHFSKDYLVDKLMEEGIIIYSMTDLMDVKLHDHLIPDFCEFLTKIDLCNLLNEIFNS